MNTCKTCAHWRAFATATVAPFAATEAMKRGGLCRCPKLREDYGRDHAADEMVYSYAEDGSFWTGPEFGCVHHKS